MRNPIGRSVNSRPLAIVSRTNGGHGSLGQYCADADRAGAFEVAQEPAGVGGGFGFTDPDEHPAGRPINGDEQGAPGRFVSHLRQILDIDLQISGRAGPERLVLGPGRFRLQIAQIAHPFAIGLEPMALNGSPAQTAVQPGARHLGVQKLPHHGEQVVERHQRHNRHRLLRRGQRSAGKRSPGSFSDPPHFAAGAACGCGHAPCPGVSICRRSARWCRTVPPEPMQAHHWPESPPAPSASSSPSPRANVLEPVANNSALLGPMADYDALSSASCNCSEVSDEAPNR